MLISLTSKIVIKVRVLVSALVGVYRLLMCGGMGKRYEMSIAKRNTEKVFLRGHYEKVSLLCVVQIHTTSITTKADVDVMTSELNQTEGQVVFTDLFERFLSIQGLANRQGNTGGDTGSAVELRNGHYDAGLRTAINEPILKKSERMALRLILNRLRINKGFTLMPSDVEIHINHNKLDNMLVKAEVLEILLRCGINYKRAVKTIDMFSDPEQVTLESAKRMEMLFPEEQPTTATPNNDKNNGKTADE